MNLALQLIKLLNVSLMDDLFLRALHCESVSRPPVWLMRQAGRYMPEYRALKDKYSFLELCGNPELAYLVTMMPIKAFEPDAAILFADILLILETLGFGLGFGKDHGPLVETHDLLKSLDSLSIKPVQEVLHYIPKTIEILKKDLKVPLIGFCGAPFTLATYVLEGRSSQHFEKTHEWVYHHREKLHRLCQILTDQTIEYLKMQIKAGANALQIFDSWLGHFSYSIAAEFSLPYLKQIVEALRATNVPIILFAKGTSSLLQEFVSLHPDAISLDTGCDLLKVKQRVPDSIALQGNLDPHLLTASKDRLKEELHRLLDGMQGRPGYIVNLGHGIRPNASYESVRLLFDTVKNYQTALSS